MSSTERKRSVVLLSGGLDSSANLAWAAERDEPVLVLTADYGQRAAAQEIQAAGCLAAYYGVRQQIVDLRWLGVLGGSALTEVDRPMPEPGAAELDERSVTERTAAAVWVPNRNGVLINVAAAYAERLGATQVVVGFNIEEAATFPDNSQKFLERASDALAYSTKNGVRVYCYTTELNKTEIVRGLKSMSRPFPFDSLWSCYLGGAQPCGTCESCRRLARALQAVC